LKILKILVTFLCILNLVSCGTPHRNSHKQRIDFNKKGVVFLNIIENRTSLPYTLRKIDEKQHKKIFIEQPTTYTWYGLEGGVNRNFGKDFLILDPGIYVIDSMGLVSSKYGTPYRLPGPGIKEKMVLYGGFEVKAGDVLELGILEVEKIPGLIFNKKAKVEFKRAADAIYFDLKEVGREDLISKKKVGRFIEPGKYIDNFL
jgi:hypothetical protein